MTTGSNTTIEHHGEKILVEELPAGRRRISVISSKTPDLVVESTVVTSYSLDLIRLMLEVSGTPGICSEIRRDEDPDCVERLLRNDIFAYFSAEDFEGKRILDFGCGCGASTVILARMFPDAKIIGVDMLASLLKVAQGRKEFYELANVEFFQSKSEDELPSAIGKFDFVILSAVYEHLLAGERRKLLPQLWDVIDDGGYLFLDQTPYRWFPFELHTTKLPLINYLPDGLALRFARRFSRRVTSTDTWEHLLREGIRGATEGEIIKYLSQNGNSPICLEPKNGGLRDRIDLYYRNTGPRMKTLKSIARYGMKAIRSVAGLTIVPDLSLAFQKRVGNDPRSRSDQVQIDPHA